MEQHFANTEGEVIPWRGRDKLAGLRKRRRDIRDSVVSGSVEWGDVRDILTRLARTIEILEQEERDFLKSESNRNLLRAWNRAKRDDMELSERREVIGQIFTSIVVMPVPAGVSDKAPFDPGLLKMAWRNAE